MCRLTKVESLCLVYHSFRGLFGSVSQQCSGLNSKDVFGFGSCDAVRFGCVLRPAFFFLSAFVLFLVKLSMLCPMSFKCEMLVLTCK